MGYAILQSGGKFRIIQTATTTYDPADSVDDLLTADPDSSAYPIFSTNVPVHGTDDPPFASQPVYNTSCWGYSLVPALCSVVWYTSVSFFGRGVPINRRTLITTQHGRHAEGETVVWVLPNGDLVTRGVLVVSEYIGGVADSNSFCLSFLDSELPESIPLMPLLHPSLYGSFDATGLPMIRSNGNGINGLWVGDAVTSAGTCQFNHSSDPLRADYWTNVINGDSGSPVFLVCGDTLVYQTNLTTANGTNGQGPWVLSRMTALQSAMDALNTTYSTSYEIETYTP